MGFWGEDHFNNDCDVNRHGADTSSKIQMLD